MVALPHARGVGRHGIGHRPRHGAGRGSELLRPVLQRALMRQHACIGAPTSRRRSTFGAPEGTTWSCFAMTEPEVVARTDLIRTNGYRDGEVGPQRAQVVHFQPSGQRDSHCAPRTIQIYLRRRIQRSDRSAAGRLDRVRRSRRCMAAPAIADLDRGSSGHEPILGGRGQNHLLGQYQLGTARLAHYVNWFTGQDRARHDGRALARAVQPRLDPCGEAGVQWTIADSAMELNWATVVLHAASKIGAAHGKDVDFKSEVSMAKRFVANSGRIADRRSRPWRPQLPTARRWPVSTAHWARHATALMRSIRCGLRSARYGIQDTGPPVQHGDLPV